MRDLHTQLSWDIDFMNMWSAVYYNKHQKEGPTFKRGEKAFLLRRNIKTKQPSQKLDHQKIGPFTIKEKIGQVNYHLKLPESMKQIHLVFHISLLEPAPKNARTQKDIEIESEDEYEVEKILSYKQVNGRPYYLVKWKDYNTSENTWEPIAHLNRCHQKVNQYHQRQKNQGSPRTKEKSPSESN